MSDPNPCSLKPRLSGLTPIASLLGKALKSVAVTRAIGRFTRDIPGQFGILLGYDVAFLAAAYQACIATSHTPLLNTSVNRSSFPIWTLFTATSIAVAQSFYCYTQHNQQTTTLPMLFANLAASVGSLALFLAPPGYAPQQLKP